MKNCYEIRDDVTAIFLKRKDGSILETLIDTDDLPKAHGFPMTWYANWHKDIKSYYVYGNTAIVNGKRKILTLHRLLFDFPENLFIDHINHDTLDNRRSNLRLVNNGENQQNLKGCRGNKKSSIYRNVFWRKDKNKWNVRITINGVRIHLGYFDDEHLAGKVAQKARSQLMPYSPESRKVW